MNVYDILGLKRIDVQNKKKLKGGNNEKSSSHSKDITLENLTSDKVIEVYEPKITRPIMSIYEYSETHTLLADYLESQKSIRNFTNDIEIKSTVNPSELAFYLLLEGKWDAIIDRGYEKVSYSKLVYNPQWKKTCEHYFKEQHIAQQKELFEPLQLV